MTIQTQKFYRKRIFARMCGVPRQARLHFEQKRSSSKNADACDIEVIDSIQPKVDDTIHSCALMFGLGKDLNEKTKEAQVFVCLKGSGDEQLHLFPCNPDKTLSMATLSAEFRGATGLEYKDRETGAILVLMPDSTGSFFHCPKGGWEGQIFSPDLSRASKVVDSWKNRVFRIEGRKLSGSCDGLDGRRILTAAHLSFKLGECYSINGPGIKANLKVRCKFIRFDPNFQCYDFAVLHSDDLPDVKLIDAILGLEREYFMMGYPKGVQAPEPTITRGVILRFHEDHVQLVGSSGSKPGYSGAPVFDGSGRLAGILLDGTEGITTRTATQESLTLSQEQPNARILRLSNILSDYQNGSEQSDKES